MAIIGKFWGQPPRGWFGPGLTQTFDTLDHLSAAGIEYIGDWVLDDEPVTLKTTHKPVVALPYNFELHDIVMMALQNHPSDEMYRRAMDQFECLYAESAERAKIMAIAMHCYLSGMPHRINHVRARLRGDPVPARRRGWDGEKILDWYTGTDAMSGSFFVPHDLKAPLRGAATGPLAGLTAVVKDMYDIAGSAPAAAIRTGSREQTAGDGVTRRRWRSILAAGATITGKTICDEFFYSVAGINAHYGTPHKYARAGPDSRRLVERLGGGAAALTPATSRSAATPAARSASRPRSMASTACAPPMAASISPARWPWRRSFDVAGWFANAPGVFRRVGGVLLRGDGGRCDRRASCWSRRTLSRRPMPRSPRSATTFSSAPPLRCRRRREVTVAPAGAAGLDEWREAFRIVQAKEVWEIVRRFRQPGRSRTSAPAIRERMAFAATVTDDQADAARKVVSAPRAHIRALVTPGTIMALPTAPSIAPPLDLRR